MNKIILFLLILFTLIGCSQQQKPHNTETTQNSPLQTEQIFTSNIPQTPIKTAAENFWNIFKTGNISALPELIEKKPQLYVTLEHAIDIEQGTKSIIFKGEKEIQQWIKDLHTPNSIGAIWGNALRVENSPERIISECDNTSCTFEGGISHNTLFIEKIIFEKTIHGKYVLKKIQLLHGD